MQAKTQRSRGRVVRELVLFSGLPKTSRCIGRLKGEEAYLIHKRPKRFHLMKKILLTSLVVGTVAGAINLLLVLLLAGTLLDTPYAGPGSSEKVPVGAFGIVSVGLTVILTLIGGLILGLLHRYKPDQAVRIWVVLGVVFLVAYGIMPFLGDGLVSLEAGILVNLLHAVAGAAALYVIPRRAGLMPQ